MASFNPIPSSATKSGDLGSTANGSVRSMRGCPGRPRARGRNNKGTQNARQDPTSKSDGGPAPPTTDKSLRPSLPSKPTLSVTASSNSPSATNPKNFSGRPSRASSTFSTSQSSPVIETPVSPALSRPSNRRRRPGAGKGNNIFKVNPPAPQDNLLRPGRPRIGPVPHSAPIKDAPPHLAPKQSRTPTGSFDMSRDIDALVERVRAVAMAENRPSTPGSHIDWAGDDDDSLPDLDDWGITSLSTPDPKTSVISPIILGGLKPLPELPASSNVTVVKPQDEISSSHNALSPSSQAAEGILSDTALASESTSEDIAKQAKLSEVSESIKAVRVADEVQDLGASSSQDSPGSGGLAQSIHAPGVALADSQRDGLAASIHAPQAIVDSSSAPARFDTPRNQQGHGRAHTVGRPFPRPSPNDSLNSRNGRGAFHSSPRHHIRNHSSPANVTNRHSHSRPILTGDAISRLAKVVGSTTTPPAKPTPVVND